MIKNIKYLVIIFSLYSFSNSYAQELFSNYNNLIISPNEIVATIDSIKITSREFFYNYEFGPAFTKKQKKSKELHLNFMIYEKLLALKGLKKNLLNKNEIQSIYCEINSDLATEELYRDSILTKVNYSESEINQLVVQKCMELEIRWLFSKNKNTINNWYSKIKGNSSFNSIFENEINDSVYLDERKLETSLFNLKKKNSKLANILETVKMGTIVKPIFVDDGWYIFSFDNVHKNILLNESEKNKLRKESVEFLTKTKMDSISDRYVNALLIENSPIIKRNVFNVAGSYIGKYRLDNEAYKKWNLENKLEESLKKMGLHKSDKYQNMILVELKSGNIKLKDFIDWYRNRELYVKLSKNNFKEYLKSLENLVWFMVRDKLLIKVAKEKKYYSNTWVKNQSLWWKEKIAYSAYKNELINSIVLDNSEVAMNKNKDELNQEMLKKKLTKKLLLEISNLKKNYKITINYNVLNKIKVSTENNKRTIDFYSAKNGGLIPRPPYPTIDNEWAGWL